MRIWKCMAFLAVAAFSGQAALAITGPHDLSGQAWSGGQICLPCHTPHKSDKTVGYLWNHAVPPETNFTTEDPNADLMPAYTLTCLGCHDGQTAIDAIGGQAGTDAMTGSEVIGTDLVDDHPVGVPYGNSPRRAPVGTIWGHQPGIEGANLPLWGTENTIQCATCHTPHSNDYGDYLRASNDGSALCIACHTEHGQ